MLRTLIGLTAVALLAMGATAPATAHPGDHATPEVNVLSMSQGAYYEVQVSGVSRKDRVRLNWGDGSATVREKSTCSVAEAKHTPQYCMVVFNNEFDEPGAYTLTVKNRKKVLLSQTITPLADKPLAGVPEEFRRPLAEPETKSAPWGTLTGYARFTPCSTIKWSYDGARATENQQTVIDDVRWTVNTLQAMTSLTFQEVPLSDDADLRVSVEDLGGGGPAGIGGWKGGTNVLQMNSQANWTSDNYAGSAPQIVDRWVSNGTAYTLRIPGRGWLVMHEMLHVLGLDHVDTPTDQPELMNATAPSVGKLGPGDREAISTLYPKVNCSR